MKPSPPGTKLILRRTFSAPRMEVFKAWTDPEKIKKWFAPGPMETHEAHVDLRVGGRYRIVMRDLAEDNSHVAFGVYREVTPPERLVFTWSWEGVPNSGEMLVTLEFREKGTRTELTLVHEFLPNEDSKRIHDEGWIACLDKLEHVINR